MFDSWVIDAEMSDDQVLCFCPIEDDGILLGMSVLSHDLPWGELVGIYHKDGDAAANAWYHNYKQIVEECIYHAKLDGAKCPKPSYIS